MFLRIIAPLLAIFGAGGKKGISRFGFVPEGCVGIRMRFGKVVRHKDGSPKLQKPGWNWLHLPFIDKTHHPSVMVQGHRLDVQNFQLKDKTFFSIQAKVSFRITDVERITVGLGNFEDQWRLESESVLISVLSKLESGELQSVDEVNDKLLTTVQARGEALGVEFVDFMIVSFEPTHATATIIQYERLISAKADALQGNARKLTGLDSTAAAILSGTAFLSTGPGLVETPISTQAPVIPLQSVPDQLS